MYTILKVIFISITIHCVRSYPGHWNNQPTLNPVHGLYVKPSGDGVTGDLFVAATEDNGVKSQWAVDQPISFLQVAGASKPHTHAPLPYPGFPAAHDESSAPKRAAIPNPIASPPVQYAYALPVPTSENNPVAPYPYVYPFPSTPSEVSSPKCDSSSTTSPYPFQFPFPFFYPQFMSAYSNAMTILKDAGFNDDTANSVMAQASPMWPPSSYGYPMYVMLDPSAWTQSQSSTTPSTSTSSSSAQEEESTQK